MKKIRNISDDLVVIDLMTINSGHEMPVLDPELLESEEVRHLLDTGKISIIDDESLARP